MKEGIKINAEDIVNFLKNSDFNSQFTVGVSEFCPYGEGRRLDMFYFNRWNRETRGYEVKVSRVDFLQDKKWESYLKFCSWFYFVAPEGIIKAEELPDKIGLIEIYREKVDKFSYNPQEKHEDDEEEYRLAKKFTKRARKLHDVEDKEYIQLLEGLLVKLVYTKNILL